MIQQFYKSNIITKYIKYLLSRTPLPMYKFIYDDEIMVAGCTYTYKDKVLYCSRSGRFIGIHAARSKAQYLTVKKRLQASSTTLINVASKDAPIPLSVTDSYYTIAPAEYYIVESFLPGEYHPGVTQQYVSNIHYYDTETHKWLGDYLRYLKNLYDLDLMPLYNCYANKTVYDIGFNRSELKTIYSKCPLGKKILLVPIKFGTDYTIAYESSTPVIMKAVIYNQGLVKTVDGQSLLCDSLDESITYYNNTDFDKPFTYSIDTRDAGIIAYERYLYLAIQVSTVNNNPIVVVEGDYANNSTNKIVDIEDLADSNVLELSKALYSSLSLLSNRETRQRPFADKLIEFLLRNTIDTREYIDDNVKNVELAANVNSGYAGQWDIRLRANLYAKYMKLKGRFGLNFQDITGYVDSDIENALRKGYMK